MYLNHGKMGAYKTVNSIIIAVCGVSSFLNLLFIIFLSLSSHFDHGLAETLLCLITFGLMSIKIGIIIWRAFMIHRLSKCRIYNSIIEEDHDGIIAYSSIAKMTGRPEANVIRDIIWLCRNNEIIGDGLTVKQGDGSGVPQESCGATEPSPCFIVPAVT